MACRFIYTDWFASVDIRDDIACERHGFPHRLVPGPEPERRNHFFVTIVYSLSWKNQDLIPRNALLGSG